MHQKSTYSMVIHIIIALCASVWLNPQAIAQCEVNEVIKLLASDGTGSDEFGISVGVSGSKAVVGSWMDDASGTGSGAAYLYVTTTGGEIVKLVPNDGDSWDSFGYAVAISGEIAIVGAYQDDDNGMNSGAAYLFDTTTGVQLHKLLPDDGFANDYFGVAVAINGATAIVGAYGDDDNGTSSGAAYLFDVETGMQTAKLLPSDGAQYDAFGVSVALSDSVAIVGAEGDSDNGSYSGSAYLFDKATGTELFKLLPSDGVGNDSFGHSVAIYQNTAVVGAVWGDGIQGNSGSAYLFDVQTGTEIVKLIASDGGFNDFFGWAVGISEQYVVVGAYGYDGIEGDSGAAYLFDAITGEEITIILPSDSAYGDAFGKSVAISGNTILCGMPYDDDGGGNTGSAYVYSITCPTILTVTPDPLIAGQNATFTVTYATPSTSTFLAYSLRGSGSTYIPQLNVTLDLNQPAQAGGIVSSDTDGTAQWVLTIPQITAGRDLWFQACQYELKSNVVTTHAQ